MPLYMESYKIIIQLLIPCICLYLIFIKNILCSSCLVNYSEEEKSPGGLAGKKSILKWGHVDATVWGLPGGS